MDVSKILSEIDAEIERLQKGREAIAALAGASPVTKRRGRPVGSKNGVRAAAAPKRKRNLSPEARKRIADAQKKRWAAQKKQAAS